MTTRPRPIVVQDEHMRKRVLDLIAALDLSRKWQVTVEPYRKKRSLSQNSLMWAWINEVAGHVREHTGMEADDVHEFFKQKFLPARVIELAGETVEHRTTTKLTTAEMSEYMDAIYRFCTSELGLLLPLPEEALNRAA